jgi:hypothetical protein
MTISAVGGFVGDSHHLQMMPLLKNNTLYQERIEDESSQESIQVIDEPPIIITDTAFRQD